jgi:hypothetical protein
VLLFKNYWPYCDSSVRHFAPLFDYLPLLSYFSNLLSSSLPSSSSVFGATLQYIHLSSSRLLPRTFFARNILPLILGVKKSSILTQRDRIKRQVILFCFAFILIMSLRESGISFRQNKSPLYKTRLSKVKLFLSTPCRLTGGVEVQLHSFVTLAWVEMSGRIETLLNLVSI